MDPVDVTSLLAQIEGAEQRVGELRQEQEDLEGFLAEVRVAEAAVGETQDRRRSLASRAYALTDSVIAHGFGKHYRALVGSPFSSRMQGDFAVIRKDAERALADVCREIGQGQELVRRIEGDIVRLRREEASKSGS